MKRILFLLSGGVNKNQNGKWETNLGDECGDNFGPTNDRLRVIAAAKLWKKDPSIIIVSSGGQGQLAGILPSGVTLASIIKYELVSYGVSPEKIVIEDKTGNTYEQLLKMAEMIKKGDVDGRVAVLTNEWHIPRINAMIRYSDVGKLLSENSIELISAEDVLLKLAPSDWKDFIERMRKSEKMKIRYESESRGIKQIKDGTYKFTH
jgi:hypothetical protein